MPEIDATDASTGMPRRTVLRGAVLVGAAVPFVAACGSSDTSDASSPPPTTKETTPGGGGSSSSDGGGATPIAMTADVPEGGGVILSDPPYVITQPTAGEFKAFTNVCTHQGCTVNNVTDGTINCICHGSMYSIADGSVVGGPAPAPLAPEDITVKGDAILEA